MQSVHNCECACHRAGDFSIRPQPGGYWLQPLGDRIDPLLAPLDDLGLEWDPCEWAWWVPAGKLGSLRTWTWLNGHRIARRGA